MRKKGRIKPAFTVLLTWVLIAFITGCMPLENGNLINEDVTDVSDYIVDHTEEKEAVILTSAFFTEDPDPLKPSGENAKAFYQLVFKNLVDLDEHQQCVPSVASEWELSEDLKTWRFVISENITFHDGSRLTAGDVLFTLETLKSYGASSGYYSAVSNIKSMEVEGRTLVIQLQKEDFTLPWKMNIPILSKKAYGSDDKTIRLTGTGPFQVVSVDDTGITLRKTDRKKLFFKLLFVSSEKEINEILKPGNNSISVVHSYEGDLYERRVDLYKNTYTGKEFVFIAFNCNVQYLNRPNVRQAIASFLNLDELTEQVFGDDLTKAEYPIHPDSFFYEWAIGTIHEYNPDKGAQLMNQENVPLYGGVYLKIITVYTKDAEGNTVISYRYTPLRLRILVNGFDSQKMAIAEKIQSDLEAAGIQTVINAQSSVKMKELIAAKDYDILVSSAVLDDAPDPYEIGILYRGGDDHKLMNVCNFPSSNDLAELSEKMVKVSSLSGMMEGLNDVQMFVKNQVPYIGLGYKKVSCVYSRTINGTFGKDVFSFFRNPESLDCR